MIEMFQPDFMQRAFLAAVLVGVTAPSIGIYLVQRRQALMGDGIGHVALTGVGLGFLFQANPMWTAVLVCVLGAVVMELVRARGNQRGDIALAMLFYGGMAGGKLLVSMSSQSGAGSLESYLWGSILFVSPGDLVVIGLLAAVVIAVTVGLRRQLFAVCQDEEFARVTGLPVRVLNLLLAVMAAVTVTVAMRVVGLLLVSALMVVPVAAAQQLTRSFAATQATAIGVGVVTALLGVGTSYQVDLPSGPTIVFLAILTFALFSAIAAPLARRRHRASTEHGPAVCDVVLPGPAHASTATATATAEDSSGGPGTAGGPAAVLEGTEPVRAPAGATIDAPLSGESLSSRGLAQ
ncbi:metal ABC transporter permease [Kitasatospora sp. YST-16]|uniref:metal ABC transporter permease n=1 Tax=Kitasatospora sp. YST-16 TaxID=2998080 RepID=UPI00228526DD|nr:metal ABC transporter permease [Kitasatospora sp. YST-16]WAL71729.1 metal ABC transporter permease [Kitasatospora sp. YST-16]WNW37770.1 metal ABC transporter permease [Streptomyces sp. Li-HN-5-13]